MLLLFETFDISLGVFTMQLCEAYTHGIAVDVCLSVRQSVKRVYCDKTKAPSEKVQL